MEYNYTVIIPFRDCIESLKIACDSIPFRDDIQIILVDNAANPVGADAVKSFSNPRIEYYTSSPDKGAGCARNVGITHACGKYLVFLDADDYFTEKAFVYFDSHISLDKDIIYFNATSINLVTQKESKRHITIDSKVKGFLASGNDDILRYQFANPVCKLVKKDLVDKYDIKFQEVPASNDLMFSVTSGHYAKDIACFDEIVYVITEGEAGSSLTKTKSLRNQESRFKVMIDWYLFLKKVGRLDLSPRVISFIINGYKDFGFAVGNRWLFYALKNKVNVFRGLI